ncbi:MAG TPA: PAS domain S-box protein [Streptosporangiaceae bacterium]|nr:PAS domain S-box protein [Streptosporangiaceae bacterium]
MGEIIDSQSGVVRVGATTDSTLIHELLLRLPVAAAYVRAPSLVFEFANEEYQRIVNRRDLIGRPMGEAIQELTPERLKVIEDVARTGEQSNGLESEIWIRQPGHEPEQLFIDFTHQPVKNEAGDVLGVLICGRDVTAQVRDRRRLEALAEHLSVTEVRHRTLFETLPQGAVHYHADGTILGANPAAGQIFGMPPESMTRWPIAEGRAVHEDGTLFHNHEFPVSVALRTGQIVADVVVGLPDAHTGQVRWLQVTAVPYSRDQRGRAQRAYAILADITDQRRAEAALRQSNRLLGRLRESNVLGVVVSAEDGTIHEANDAYLDIIGYSREDLETGRVNWRMLTLPEWKAHDRRAIEQLRLTGSCRPFDKEYAHKDGHRVPVLIGSAVIGWNPLRFATFVVDLTAHQRREHERTALIERVQDARREAETAKERLDFLLQAGDLVGDVQNRGDLLDRVSQLVDAAASGNQDRVTGAGEASEATRAHEALTALNAELDERVRQRTSELIRAEEDRRQLENDLRRSERMQTVGQLTSGIAHDFGNLLAVIVGYAEIADDLSDQADPELHRLLGEIRGAANRAVRLSSDLLRFSQRTRAKPEPIDLNALIAGITDLLNVSMRGRAEVKLESSPALPAVLSEPGRLEQVLLNLAVNARDAMPEGGTLTISTNQVDFSPDEARLHPAHRAGHYVELAVKDTGNGMSADVRERIFERFFTTKPAGQGTGLGLSTVYGIIKDAAGTIDVDSHEGQGTTFRIYLPAVESRQATAGLASGSRRALISAITALVVVTAMIAVTISQPLASPR